MKDKLVTNASNSLGAIHQKPNSHFKRFGHAFNISPIYSNDFTVIPLHVESIWQQKVTKFYKFDKVIGSLVMHSSVSYYNLPK